MFKKINKKLIKSKTKYQKLRSLIDSDNYFDFLKYLFYRIKYPLVTKIFTKLILFLELFLIYKYFNNNIFGEVSLIIFFTLIFGKVFRSLIEYFRIKIFAKFKWFQKSTIQSYLSSMEVISIAFGLFTIISCLILFNIVFISAETKLFLYLTLIAMPFEYYGVSLWSFCYLYRRVKKDLFIVFAIRSLPTICLLLFYQIGILSYAIGYLLSRLLEAFYHIYLSKSVIEMNYKLLNFKLNNLKISFSYILKDKLFYRYFSYGIVISFLPLILSIFIYIKNPNLWSQYFIIYFLISFFSYFSKQIFKIMKMDFYLLAKRGNIIKSEKYFKNTLITFVIVNISISTLLTLIFLSEKFSYILNGVIGEYWGYFIIILFFKSLYLSIISYFESIKSELAYQKYLYIMNFLILPLLLFIFLYHFNLGLKGVFLIEALYYLISSVYFLLNKSFDNSLVHKISQKNRFNENKIMRPVVWSRCKKIFDKLEINYSIVILQLDPVYADFYHLKNIVKELNNNRNLRFYCSQITRGYLIAIVNKQHSRLNEVQYINKKLSGFVRSSYLVDQSKTVSENFSLFFESSKYLYESSKTTKAIKYQLEMLSNEKFFNKTSKKIIDQNFDIEKILEKYIQKKLPVFIYKDSKNIQHSIKDRTIIEYGNRLCSFNNGLRYFIHPLKRYIIFSTTGKVIALVDLKGSDIKYRNELLNLSYVFNVVSSIKDFQTIDNNNFISPLLYKEITNSFREFYRYRFKRIFNESSNKEILKDTLYTKLNSGFRCLRKI